MVKGFWVIEVWNGAWSLYARATTRGQAERLFRHLRVRARLTYRTCA